MAIKRLRRVADELANADLGDARRSRRLKSLAEAFCERPSGSLPKAMGSDAALEGAYRLLNSAAIESAEILQPHIDATCERAAAAGRFYAVSDTTELRFGGDDRIGLGPLQGGGHGFLAHVCLAVASDGSRMPLGVLGVETIVRPDKPKKRRGTSASRRAGDRESIKWKRVALSAEAAIGRQAEVIHVMDREADIYDLFAELHGRGHRFIIRVGQNRSVLIGDDTTRLFAALEKAQYCFSREVPLSRRKRTSKKHVARAERRALLSVCSARFLLRRPNTADLGLPAELPLNFLHVFEETPPPGEKPVDWKIVTTEPIDTQSQLEAIVDGYRTRWVIEEFFKALKSGCGIEKSQLESVHALLNLLAVKLPVACQLLALRSHAESNADALAAGIFTPLRLEVLRVMSRGRLSQSPTTGEALLAVAALGGHIKNNGPPGWHVLGSGFEDLLRYEAAWVVFTNREARSDQS
jgi:hypothetical protein